MPSHAGQKHADQENHKQTGGVVNVKEPLGDARISIGVQIDQGKGQQGKQLKSSRVSASFLPSKVNPARDKNGLTAESNVF